VPERTKPADPADRYWRTFLRKTGEDLDLAGKALGATAGAGVFAPLAAKGVINLPTLPIGAILVASLAMIAGGIHLQAKVKPDE
jgi:hypothetical protein